MLIKLIKLCFAFCLLLIPCHTFAQMAQTSDDKRISFTVSAAPWNLTLPKSDLVVEERELKPDGRSAYFSMTDEKNKLTISFYIEPAKDCKDSKSCRDMVWKIGNPSWKNLQNVVQSEIEGANYFEFLLPSFQGVEVKQQNMYVEYVKDGFWVDLHISKILYKTEEHELFERVIKSLKFEAKNTSSKAETITSKALFNYLAEGSAFYLKGDYRNAIKPYQKALDMEKQQPSLEKKIWRVLVDNLGMAMGFQAT